MIAIWLIIVVGAMLTVRIGWNEGAGGRQVVAAAGWVVAAAALTALAVQDGAWGLAVGTVAGMIASLGMVLYAGWRSPAKLRRAAREAPAIATPRQWSDLSRRVAVFSLVVPVASAAAQSFAFGVQAIARRGGLIEADAIVLTLFLQPIAWCMLMTIQMTRARTAEMIAPPIVAAALGAILWSAS